MSTRGKEAAPSACTGAGEKATLRADPGMSRAQPLKPLRPSLPLALASLLGLAASGCTPAIGDRCTLSTDCSVQGTRICDTFEPNGYCTVACSANGCPDNAACVEFAAGVPGCGYSDYAAPSRLARSMCMKTCGSDSDCRTDEGYSCVSTATLGTTVAVLDTNQAPHICMVAPTASADSGSASLPVCTADRPDAPPLDLPGSDGGAIGADAGADADAAGSGEGGPLDGGVDAEGGAAIDGGEAGGEGGGMAGEGGEGGGIAGDGGPAEAGDATIGDGGDDGSDATLGQPTDAGAADAPDEQ
jgi:hypothetical protein